MASDVVTGPTALTRRQKPRRSNRTVGAGVNEPKAAAAL